MKELIQLENAGAQTPLHLTAWLPTSRSTKLHKDHATIGPSLQCLHLINKNLKLTSHPGPLSLIKHNLNFTPYLPSQFQWEAWPYVEIRAEQFFNIKHSKLKCSTPPSPSGYMSSKDTFSNTHTSPQTGIENTCLLKRPVVDHHPNHMLCLSCMPYSKQKVKNNRPCLKLEQNLNLYFTEMEWDYMLHNIHKSSVNFTI